MSGRGRLLVAFLVLAGCAACSEGDAPGTERPALSLVETLGGADTVGYARARERRVFDFPADHGAHPAFRTEWWYVTGNLSAEDGRDFGFQLTIFRNALAPLPPGGPSSWATNQAYMGHFALTDVGDGSFHAFELFARGGGGLAGAQAEPLRVWIEDWTIASTGAGVGGPRAPGSAEEEPFPLRVSADGDGVALDLVLDAGKPLVLQGEDGLSRKGSEPGNASYYYAYTRMPAHGTVITDGDTARVEGSAWLDREWSTSALSDGQVGWDWFALQLDDRWDLMVYRLRHADGSADPSSDGVVIDPSGRRVPLEWGRDVIVEETGTWASPVDGSVYPSGWRIRVPDRGWDLTLRPALLDQELRLAFRYWEGSVSVEGTGERGRPVRGRGYVELTGYAATCAACGR